jgi:hypothetical protein
MRHGTRLLKLETLWPSPGCPVCLGYLPALVDDAAADDVDTTCASCGRLRRPVLRAYWEAV